MVPQVPASHATEPDVVMVKAPKISVRGGGTAKAGAFLDSEPGSWEPADAEPSYQWMRGDEEIAGATEKGYRLAAADRGARISLVVTMSKVGFTSKSGTSASIDVLKAMTTATPKFTGIAVKGRTLTAKPGNWVPKSVKLSYQWLRNGKAIKKATKSQYKLVAADVKKTISLRVTGKKTGHETAVRVSSGKKVFDGIVAKKPKIVGIAMYGKRLTAKASGWGPTGVKLQYQWRRDGIAVAGATGSSYKLRAADVGHRITVSVVGKLSHVPTRTKTSKATNVVSYPTHANPVSKYRCPVWAPIKGNANSGIFHVPGQRFYNATQPEDCFRTEAAARKWGYRKAKV